MISRWVAPKADFDEADCCAVNDNYRFNALLDRAYLLIILFESEADYVS